MSHLTDRITDLHRNRFALLKEKSRPKIGWISIYTPEEILYAAGLIPYRITGETRTDTSKAGGYMHRNICSYVLSCLEEALDGEHDFCAGVLMVNACDGRRRLYDVWRYFLKTPFVHLVDLPKSSDSAAKIYYVQEFRHLINTLEREFRVRISDDALGEAIALCNETRTLLQRLYALRKQENPPISGSEAINIVKSGMTGLKKAFNRELSELLTLLREIPHRAKNGNRHRVLICGSYFDQTEISEIIEQTGAVIVCEDISNGVKYFEGQVRTDGDPVEALGEYYMEKATCARMVDSEKRFDHLWALVQEYGVQSVIYLSLKFCDTNMLDFPYIRQRLSEKGVPVLFLEPERTGTNIGQISTRIEAFMETRVNMF